MQETALAPLAFYSAAPTIQVGGQGNELVTSLLLSMEMREHEGGLSALELRLTNVASQSAGASDFAFEDGSVLALGTRLVVYAGQVNSPTEIFRGTVTALEGRFRAEGPPELLVLAEDALQGARMARRTKTYENITLAQLIAQVAGALGLTPITNGLDTPVGTQQQFNESDLYFARRVLARYDADLQVVGAELHAAPRSQTQRASIALDLGSQLRELRVTADLADQVTTVTATGWDYNAGQRIAAASRTNALGPGAGATGAAWLSQAAFASRSEQLGKFVPLDATEAQVLADSEYAERARSFVRAHGVCDGNPNLRVGSALTLGGIGPRFSNTYYTTATTHRFDLIGGYQTSFTAECAYLGAA